MTKRKSELRLPARTPAYVCQEVGAAELGISPQTWNEWVRQGVLPPPHPGFPRGTRRWSWQEVQAHLAGQSPIAIKPAIATVEDFVARAAGFRFAKKKGRVRALAA